MDLHFARGRANAAALLCFALGCSAESYMSSSDDAGSDRSLDGSILGDGSGGGVTPREYVVNAASSLGNVMTNDIRICPSQSAPRALPYDHRVPLSSYAGIPAGGFAEMTSASYAMPFALDALYVAKLEPPNVQQPCSALFPLIHETLPDPPAGAAPRALVLVGDPGEGGGSPLSFLSFDVGGPAPVTTSVRFGLASPWLANDYDLARVSFSFGDLSAGCSAPRFTGALKVGEASSPITVALPADIEASGLTLCAPKKGGTAPEVVLAQSLLEIATRSAPDMAPSAFLSQATLFLALIVGDKAPNAPARAIHALFLPFPVSR